VANGFKRALFGFKRKDVIAYLEQIDVDHRKEIDRAEKDGSANEKRIAELLAKVDELSARCDGLASERAALIEQKESALAEKAAVESDMTELVATNENLQNKIYQCESEKEKIKVELNSKLDAAESKSFEQAEKIANYEKLIAEREVLYTQAVAKAEADEKLISKKNAELEVLQMRVSQLSSDLEAAKANIEKDKIRKTNLSSEKKRRDAVAAILSYVRKR
jgi:chromosome segregation ATPase